MTVRALLARLWRRQSPPEPLRSVDAYARWAAAYPPVAHNILMQTEETAMLALMPPLAGQRILDLGSGSGRYARIAQTAGAASVLGLDNSPAMLHHNRFAVCVQSSMDALPLASQSVDGVVCGLAVGHIPALTACYAEISRVLVPGGWALVSDFHPFAFLSGGRRTFQAADGQTYAIEHYLHLYEDHHRAAHLASLTIEAIAEPRLPQSSTGSNLPAPMPIVLVLKLLKPP
ncbi:MAG: class I SAM-dependent methyltransferase [Anaerolineae bacterium]|nr:class I SAM-dependent methyltransferase [Anaerolineae bacterium]